MNAKQLIEENNKKRMLLTKENEAYYSDLLVYIRLQFTLSEQQSEEVLMEMLDHLIEGQQEGKTAKEIFGNDPLSYTDEIIEQLPKEEKKNIWSFVGGIIVSIVSWVLIIRGVIFLVVSPFTTVHTEINFFQAGITSLVIGIFIVLNTWFILREIKSSLFNAKGSTKKSMFKVGFVSATSMVVVILVVKLIPHIGPSFNLNGWASIVSGAILWLIHFIVKKNIRKGAQNRQP